jgi:hypothetical protein
MPYVDKLIDSYMRQKRGAKSRGISFKFTFEEWISWWKKNLGSNWFKLRGHNGHQYVMARKKDKGPYDKYNVECITASQNMTDSNHNNPRGGGPHFLGKRHSLKSLKKMSSSHSGSKNPFFGRRHSVATRIKMSNSQLSRYK